jgi:hypothetical protein
MAPSLLLLLLLLLLVAQRQARPVRQTLPACFQPLPLLL